MIRGDLALGYVCGVAGFAIGMTAGIIAATSKETVHWHREAVARGVAEYDAKTGEWKWTVERKVAE